MSVDLKPCPFCGGQATLATASRTWLVLVTCLDCFVEVRGRDDEEARDTWNDRAASPGCAQHSPSLTKAATLLKDCRRLLPGSTLGDKLRSRIGAQLREWGAL